LGLSPGIFGLRKPSFTHTRFISHARQTETASMVKLWCISDDNGESLRCQSEGHWHKSRDGVAVLEATPVAASCACPAASEARHPRELPPTCRLMSVTVGDGYIEEASPRKDWADNLIATQASGNAWLARGVAPVLRVPGLSGAAQYLFNT